MSVKCKHCGSENLWSRGTRRDGTKSYQCRNCPNWTYITPEEQAMEGSEAEYGDNFINIVCASKRVMSKEDILSAFEIDLNEWEVESYKIKTSEGYRKDRKVEWEVDDGTVTKGRVEDTGKMLVVPLYHIQVRLVKKVKEIEAKNILEMLAEDAKKFAPKYPEINYPQYRDGMLYEIDLPDIHFGRLTWNEESGEDYDIKIAYQVVNTVLDKLLAYAKQFPVSRILLPLGNDFFNVDSKLETTTRGTPQQEDTRWQKTFNLGRKLACMMIDKCSSIAPVDVLIVVGNHDEQRMFYLGAVLEGWYSNNLNVSINNEAIKRKYYKFGQNLIGFTHGYWEKLHKLPYIMAVEQPDAWATTKNREWHTGDKHHKKDLLMQADEGEGMMIRILRSLAGTDTWTFDSGFVGPARAGESFLWHPDDGVIAQFTATP